VVALVSLAVVAGSLAGPWSPDLRGESSLEPSPIASVAATPEPTLEPDPMVSALKDMDIRPWHLTTLWLLLATVVALLFVYLGVRWLRLRTRRRRGAKADAWDLARAGVMEGEALAMPDLPALREGLLDADEHLRRSLPPADAVIAAWVALEDAAGRSGIVRHPASTPTEFTVQVLDRTAADRGATRTLLALYLQARFGSDPMTPEDVRAATEAVRVLTADLAADVEPSGPDAPHEASGATTDGAPDDVSDVVSGDAPGDAPGETGAPQ
jgi:hypothetical protein